MADSSDLEMALAAGGMVVETNHSRRLPLPPRLINEWLETDGYDKPVPVKRCPPFPLAALME